MVIIGSLIYRRAVLIYNPAAGRQRTRRHRVVNQAVAVLEREIEQLDAWPTEAPQAATELARRACQGGAELVLVCGGDGTVNEVVNGLAHTAVPLAVLPAGTANVLAREVGLPLDPVEAAGGLARLEPRRIGLGRICREGGHPRYFLLLAGIGLDARIVYHLDLRWKSRLGVLAYWLAGFAQLGRRLERFEVEVEGSRYECTFALAARSSTYGGNLHIARRAHLLAEDFEVVLFHTRSTVRYLGHLAAVLRERLEAGPDVRFLRARRLELGAAEESPVRIEADGEYVGRLPAAIELAPDALTLLLPASYVRVHG